MARAHHAVRWADRLGLATSAVADVACLGLALSLAALLARYRLRKVSLLAALGSGLMLAGWLGLAVFGAQQQ